MQDLDDDDILELEEVEGLMDNAPVTKIGSRTRNVKQNRTEKVFCTLQSSRRLIGILSIVAMLMMVFLKDIWTSENNVIDAQLSHTSKKEHHDKNASLLIENHNFTIEESNDEKKESESKIESKKEVKSEDKQNLNQEDTKESNTKIEEEEDEDEDEDEQQLGQDESENKNTKEEKDEDEHQIDDNKNEDENNSQLVQEEIEKWGKWGFWDGEEEIRPSEDYCGKYENRDIPGDEFPDNAWQTDAVYVNHFLDAAAKLVTRAQEVIYTEYGWGKDDLTEEEREKKSKMFHLKILDLETDAAPRSVDGGGWTTKKSLDGLVLRLLHAMMTNDTFTVVMGGHSAAAGHGNHFKQSYMMSFHHFMEPIFERLGVKLITRNLAHGGLGTLQSALGSGSIYGDQIDVLVWDSSMTEKEVRAHDIFFRQALLAGKRMPFLWNGDFKVLKMLHNEAGADVGTVGTGRDGIEVTLDEEQVKELPWASQYLVCGDQNQNMCNDPENKYRTRCWIDRPDVTPARRQVGTVEGRAGWHPGWRHHQLTGRVMAFTILTALQDAINQWSKITIREGFPLDDTYWHVTDYYQDMRKKVQKLNHDPSDQFCEEYASLEMFPRRVCTTALKARSEFVPRADPENTSIIGILKPTSDGGVPQLKEDMLYNGPDLPIPELEVPAGEINARSIVSNRRLHVEDNALFPFQNAAYKTNILKHTPLLRRRVLRDDIEPGSGWSLNSRPGLCDGSYDAICGREPSSNCLLSGHMDFRGGILGDGLSGWLIMNIENVEEGLIVLKLETWHAASENAATKDWEEVNNGNRRHRSLYREGQTNFDNENKDWVNIDSKVSLNRALKTEPLPYCDDFEFRYSIDGEITTLNKDEFEKRMTNPQRVVELLTIMDDESMAGKGKSRDIELGIQLIGCKREKTFSLTHVYWA